MSDKIIESFLDYISHQKRYSPRTAAIYADAMGRFAVFCAEADCSVLHGLNVQNLRAYQIHLLEDMNEGPRTVNLHLSVISSFCRYLVRQGMIKSNPVSLLTRPRLPKRLPVFFRSSAVTSYLESDNVLSRRDFELPCDNGKERKALYMECLRRAIVSTLFCTGLRRAELISLNLDSLDAARGVLRVVGKGDKMREIPLVPACIQEISLYLQAACTLLGEAVEHPAPLFLSFKCKRLTPNQVDKAVKDELEQAGKDFAGRRSPHVLRHSYATALLEGGAGLDSIKEVLGHANLAATQIYTHSNPAQLKRIYKAAHPRSGKKDGKD